MAILKKADPMQELLAIQRQINRFFEERLSLRGEADPRLDPLPSGAAWIPPIDMYETAGALVVEAELAGFRDADLDVRVDGDRLVIRGERNEAATSDRREPGGAPGGRIRARRKRPPASGVDARDGAVFHRVEREYGAFQRSFSLPAGLDGARMTRSYRDGVLRVALEKRRGKG